MKRLQELRSLVDLARKFGQEPAADILEQLSQLEAQEQRRLQREAEIKQRIAADITEMFQPTLAVTQPVVEAVAVVEPKPEPVPPPELPVKASTVDLVAQAIAESGVVAPDPVLAQPQKDLAQEIKYLREWVGRIAATGAGSGEVNFRWLDDVDRSSINKDWFLNYEPSTKKFTFVDTRVSTEAFDRSSSIALTATPALLRPSSTTNVKNMTYDSSTGVFTFLRQCEVSLAISLNALSSASGQRVYQYAERNTGSGWQVIANSGKNFQLQNGVETQIVNAQTISRLAGEQIRYWIYSDSDKVILTGSNLPGLTGNTVYVPAIRIQYAGR